jgi:hypothetical protein
MAENTTGSGSGLKHAKPFNFGFMAGVRQLRDEEYQDQYKPSLTPPGSSNFLKIAQEQFNMEEAAGGSGYMAEEPGNTPAWRRVPEHLVKLRLPKLLYDGTALDDPRDDYEGGIAGQWSAKMRKHGQVGQAPLPGYDGAVSGYYAPGGGEEDAVEGAHEVVESSGSVAAARARATKEAATMLIKKPPSGGRSVASTATMGSSASENPGSVASSRLSFGAGSDGAAAIQKQKNFLITPKAE